MMKQQLVWQDMKSAPKEEVHLQKIDDYVKLILLNWELRIAKEKGKTVQ